MAKESRSTMPAMLACAAAARQCAQVCRDAYAQLTPEACARCAEACEACARACDQCGDFWCCRRAAEACRDCAAICRAGPSDDASSATYGCARACDDCAATCESSTRQDSRAAPLGDREVRMCPGDVAEVRAEEDDGKMFLTGYAAPFNSLSQDLGGFRERIKTGAFKRALDSGMDVICVPDHAPRACQMLGRTGSGTLKLSQNDVGLRFRCQLPDTTAGRDIFQVAKRKDVRGMSFSFSAKPEGERWSEENGVIVRELDDLDLFDVSPVVHPAYPATTVSVARRALDQVEQLRAPKRSPGRLKHLLRHIELERMKQ